MTEPTAQVKRSRARSLLRQYYEIEERRFTGDYGACDELMDFHKAIGQARLTKKQAKALTLIYGEDLRQEDVCKRKNGITHVKGVI